MQNMKRSLIIAGASGHGKVIADIAVKTERYDEIVFLDDNPKMDEIMGFAVIGSIVPDEVLFKQRLGEGEIEFIIAIGNSKIRMEKQELFENAGMKPAILIHPTAVIGMDVKIGRGSVVMANAVVNSGTSIGKGCIINTAATVDHDNSIEDFVHVSVGAHLAGTVNVKSHTWIGAGAVVSNNITISATCTIGAGAVVVKDICQSGIYIGVPAKLKKS